MPSAHLISAPPAAAPGGDAAPFVPIPSNAPDPTGVLVWVAILIAAAVLGSMIIALVRARYRRNAAAGSQDLGVMEHLRTLRDSGAITEAEFQAARTKLIGRVSASIHAQGRPNAEPTETPSPTPKPQRPNPPRPGS